MPNVYYNPEAFGLTKIAELECTDGCYQFDTIVVWRLPDGVLGWHRDAGCSCPTPFDEVTLETIERDPEGIAVIAQAKAALTRATEDEWSSGYPKADDVAAFITRVRDAVRESRQARQASARPGHGPARAGRGRPARRSQPDHLGMTMDAAEKALIDGIREVLAIYHEHGYLPCDATVQSECDDEPVDACDALCSMVEALVDRYTTIRTQGAATH